MRRARSGSVLLGAALGLSLVLLSGSAHADALADGKSAFTFGNWAVCIDKLFAVLNPVSVGDVDAVDAREHLAACYFHRWISTGSADSSLREKAEEEIVRLLSRDMEHRLRATLSEDFRRFFEGESAKYRDAKRAIAVAEAKAKAAAEESLKAKIREEFDRLYAAKEPTVVKISRERDHALEVAHFVPAYGQIYNKDYVWAAAFGATELGLGALSLYTYLGLRVFLREDCSTLANPDVSRWSCPAVYAPERLPVVRTFRTVNAISTVGLVAVIFAGWAHAAVSGRDLGYVTREMTTAEKIRLGLWKPPGDFAPEPAATAGTAGDDPAPKKHDKKPRSAKGGEPGKPEKLDETTDEKKPARDGPKLFLVPFEAAPEAGATLGLGLELKF